MRIRFRHFAAFTFEHGLVRLTLAYVICLGAAVLASLMTTPYHHRFYLTWVMRGQYSNFFREAFTLLAVVLPWMLLARRTLAGVFATVSVLLLILGIQGAKLHHLNMPLSSADLYSLANYEVLRPYGEILFLPQILMVALGLLILGISLPSRATGLASYFKLGWHPFAGKAWVAAALTLSIVWGWSLTTEISPLRKFIQTNVDLPLNLRWDEKSFSANNGVVTSFLFGFGAKRFTRPPNYTAANSERLIASVEQANPPSRRLNTRSVVILLVESFIDVNNLTLKLSADPTPGLHRLQKEKASFLAEVPTVFGNTANTEFELLTGLGLDTLPKNSIPFLNHVVRPIHSIARVFSENGFEVSAFHNLYSSSWRRFLVWPLLGFENTAFLKKGYPRRELGWPDDQLLFDRILEQLTSQTAPQFIFGVTVNTHGPFQEEPLEPDDVRVLHLPAAKATSEEVELFLKRLKAVDRQVVDFIEQLDSLGVEYLVLGDHHPPVLSRVWPLSIPERTLGRYFDDYLDPKLAAQYFTPAFLSIAGIHKLPSTHIATRCLGSFIAQSKGLRLSSVSRVIATNCEDSDYRNYTSWRRTQNPNEAQSINFTYDVLNTALGGTETGKGPGKSSVISWEGIPKK